jgi:hypothetical protein
MEFLMLFSSPFIMPKTTKIRLVANMTHGAEPVGRPSSTDGASYQLQASPGDDKARGERMGKEPEA